jgi:hypothetical protein
VKHRRGLRSLGKSLLVSSALSVVAVTLIMVIAVPTASASRGSPGAQQSVAFHSSSGASQPFAHFFKPRTPSGDARNPQFSGFGNLRYHSGPTMRITSTTYAIFWEPSGSTVSAMYNSLIQHYFGDVGGSGLYNNNTQYYDAAGHIANSSGLGGAWVDTSAYSASGCTDSATPAGCLSDAQIQAEVSRALSVNGWTGGFTHVFFVFTARGEGSCYNSSACSFTQFCAYHSSFTSGGQTVLYANMPYTDTDASACDIPSGKSPNGDIAADSTINVTSHEHMETVTDPNGNAWYDFFGYEIGDKCAWTFGTVGSTGANVTWNGHAYIAQREWDNHSSGCALSGS